MCADHRDRGGWYRDDEGGGGKNPFIAQSGSKTCTLAPPCRRVRVRPLNGCTVFNLGRSDDTASCLLPDPARVHAANNNIICFAPRSRLAIPAPATHSNAECSLLQELGGNEEGLVAAAQKLRGNMYDDTHMKEILCRRLNAKTGFGCLKVFP